MLVACFRLTIVSGEGRGKKKREMKEKGRERKNTEEKLKKPKQTRKEKKKKKSKIKNFKKRVKYRSEFPSPRDDRGGSCQLRNNKGYTEHYFPPILLFSRI